MTVGAFLPLLSGQHEETDIMRTTTSYREHRIETVREDLHLLHYRTHGVPPLPFNDTSAARRHVDHLLDRSCRRHPGAHEAGNVSAAYVIGCLLALLPGTLVAFVLASLAGAASGVA